MSGSSPDGGMSAVVRLNPHSEIYKAHFPGFPVTPGACLFQIALDLLGPQAVPDSVKEIKFLSPVFPQAEETVLRYDFEAEGENLRIRITEGDTLKARMTIHLKSQTI